MILFFFATMGVSCSPNAAKNGTANVVSSTVPIDYGNDVYYFPVTEKEYAVSLSSFLGNHPELELLSMTGNGNSSYGRDAGYFTVFKKK